MDPMSHSGTSNGILFAFLGMLSTTDYWMSYWVYLILYTIMGIVPNYCLTQTMTTDAITSTWYVKAYIIADLVLSVADGLWERWTTRVFEEIDTRIVTTAYNRYDTLSYQSRNQLSGQEFARRLDDGGWALIQFANWGVPKVISMIVAIISTMWVFYRENMLNMMLLLIAGNIVLYYLVTKKLQERYTKERDTVKEIRQTTYSMIDAKMPSFEAGSVPASKIIDLKTKLIRQEHIPSTTMTWISMVTNVGNGLPMLLFLVHDTIDISGFLLFTNIYRTFTNSLSQFMSFFNQYGSMEARHDNCQDMWNGLEYKDKPTQIPVPPVINIESVNMSHVTSKFSLTGNKMQIVQGSTNLIVGPSGGGKSTFINGILGKIAGITLDVNRPENYYGSVAECYQDIRGGTPTKNITIRQLFDDETDDELIKWCLDQCCALSWALQLGYKKKTNPNRHSMMANLMQYVFGRFMWLPKKKEKIDDVEAQLYNDKEKEQEKDPHIFDRMIQQKHSGGEKSRLVIATKLYQLLKKGGRIFVMDEPEQGSDPDIAYRLVQNILKACRERNVTVICCSHLELIRARFEWTKVIRIEEGRMNVE